VRNNILKVWEQTTANDRYDWYREALIFAHEITRKANELGRYTTARKACGVIAALSPMVKWEKNLELAYMLVVQDVSPEDMPCLKTNARKAKAILESNGSDPAILEILSGKKVSAFFLNIQYPDDSIHLTMDRHAVSIAIGKKLTDEKLQMTAGQYEFLSECYRYTAAKLGINALLLQSATWLFWRRNGRSTEIQLDLNL